jgi:hypothetical protein
MKKILLVALMHFVSISLFAQTSSVRGTVKDETTGETLPGVKVMVEGLATPKVGMTDFDGKFNLQGIPVGTYSITFKYATYNTKNITDVVIKAGEPTVLDVLLGTAVSEQAEVVVTATMKKESSASLLLTQKNAATVSDGISSESIRKTPDRSTSDVLKRISGASIQENKFAVIRGLNDRYNAAYINGAPLPSSESDRKAFSFDIFPANMLDNLVILKTATPDLPGEFAGGVIQVNTKSIPEEKFQSFTIGGGYNTIATGKEKVTYKGGKYDWIGLDDGNRALPKSIPGNSVHDLTIPNQGELAKTFEFDWSLNSKKFAPNTNMQYAFGWNKKNEKNRQFGIVAAANYNRTNIYNETNRNSFEVTTGVTPVQKNEYLDKNYISQTMAGVLANLSLKWNDNNQLGFKNVLSVNSDDRVVGRTGITDKSTDGSATVKSNLRWFTSNQIYTGQIIGDHFMPKSKFKLNWVGSYSRIQRDIPNMRRSVYVNADPNDPNSKFELSTGTSLSTSGSMFFAKNIENMYSFKVDGTLPFEIGKNLKNELKLGGFTQYRERTFFARSLAYDWYGAENLAIKGLPLSEVYTIKNMGVNGFRLDEITKPSDSYTASSNLFAGFLMLDNKFKKNLRLIWGVRAEQFQQKLTAVKQAGDTIRLNNPPVLDILPSANFIWSMTEKQNLRLSYSNTLNRPEYRELAPFAFFDFTTAFTLSGNEKLTRAKIQNFDFRYELYPGKGQIVSASVFNKQFDNPIETISDAALENQITYQNVKSATNYGVELEVKFILASLLNADSSKFLNNLTLFSNLAIIRSSVDLSGVSGAVDRPLQGQSPYVFNAGINYQHPETELSFALNANQVGQRIFIVGNQATPNIWENSRMFLDFQVTKSFVKKKLEVKLNVQNILAQRQIFYQKDENSTGAGGNSFFNNILYGDKLNRNGYDKEKDMVRWNTNFGRTISATISYRF